MFRGCKPEDMPPHIYATAQIAYRNMLSTRLDQSLVLMGRSGSGKTANARHALTYLTAAAGTINNLLTGKQNLNLAKSVRFAVHVLSRVCV